MRLILAQIVGAAVAMSMSLSAIGANRSPSVLEERASPGRDNKLSQANDGFRCVDWKKHLSQSKSDDMGMAAFSDGYMVGFAHGLVSGILSDPMGTFEAAVNARPLTQLGSAGEAYRAGLVAALRRPAVLADAFDKRCGDYANERVSLDALTLIVVAELGGTPASKIDKALEVARSNRSVSLKPIVDALSAR